MTVLNQVEEAVVEPVAVTSDVAVVETPVENTEVKTEDTEITTETPTDVQDTSPAPVVSEIDMYREIVAKSEQDSDFEMTIEECDIFQSVRDKVNNGEIKEPSLTPDKKEPEAKVVEEKVVEKESSPVKGLDEKSAKLIQDAMKTVGAKDISELPNKVKDLYKVMTSSGAENGNKLKAIESELETRANNHADWLTGIRNGDASALKHFKDLTGIDLNGSHPTSQKNESDVDGAKQSDTDGYLDDDLAKIVLPMQAKLAEQAKIIEKLNGVEEKRVEDFKYESGKADWLGQVDELITTYADDFNISRSEARNLGKFYWSKEGATSPVDPRFQEIHDLLVFTNDNNLPDIQSAHVLLQNKNGNLAKKILKQAGQQKQHAPSINSDLSHNQGRAGNTSQTVTESDVDAMLNGDLNKMPAEWMDKDGTLIRSKIPAHLQKKLLG